MPPKSGRKRGRDSTGSTGTPSPESQNQPSSALPGSAPPAASFSRTTRSNSNSSQQEDDAGGSGSSGGGGDPRATKRSRHGGPAGREADSSGDVGMGEVTNVVTKTPTAAAAAASAGAKKGGGRRKSTSVVVANGNVRVLLAQFFVLDCATARGVCVCVSVFCHAVLPQQCFPFRVSPTVPHSESRTNPFSDVRYCCVAAMIWTDYLLHHI